MKKSENTEFNYIVDRFADVEILRYKVHGFEELPLKQKKFIYCLAQAAKQGRDILFDQNYKHNLLIRKVLEGIFVNYKGDKNTEDFLQFEVYLKRVWFSNGIHHHYAMDKFTPGFSKDFFVEAYNNSFDDEELLNNILPLIFDTNIDAKRANQAENEDLILTSANNYYADVSQKEVEDFYNAKRCPNDLTPISYGLNSRLTKNKKGKLFEEVWNIRGKYYKQIEKIIYWLKKAKLVAENKEQKTIIGLLINFYLTGDLKTFDEYSIAWVQDTKSHVDFLNGFIETYGDPLGIKASWEALVNFKDVEATRRTEIISENAQWFEDNSPVDERFKKKEVKGVSAKVVTVAMLGGDCYPASPMGINLPNSNWIRQVHGSKSVTLDNITDAYDKASQGTGFNEEFICNQVDIDRRLKYGKIVDSLHTDLHECLGHGSGQLLSGVNPDALKAYGAVIEEARADLFALYYIADQKIVEIELLPDHEAYKAAYHNYMMNGLMTQLVRIELGNNIEQAHMRNRQMVAKWVLANSTNTVEFVEKDGKKFIKINNYEKLRLLFGKLLQEIQRIKSEGDYQAAKKLVESYGIKIDKELHAEVLERYKKLNIAPYRGFVNPNYYPVCTKKGKITDIKIDYSEDYTTQHLMYSQAVRH